MITTWTPHQYENGATVYSAQPVDGVTVVYAVLPDGHWAGVLTSAQVQGKFTASRDHAELLAHRLADRAHQGVA